MTTTNKRSKGTIKTLDPRGFGFIRGADATERFFHYSALTHNMAFERLRVGLPVEFTPTDTARGARAEEVTILAGAADPVAPPDEADDDDLVPTKVVRAPRTYRNGAVLTKKKRAIP